MDTPTLTVGLGRQIAKKDVDVPAEHVIPVVCDKGDVVSVTYDQANYPTLSVYVNTVLKKRITGRRWMFMLEEKVENDFGPANF